MQKNIRDLVDKADGYASRPTESLLQLPEVTPSRPWTRSTTEGQGVTERSRGTIKQAIRDGALSTAARQLLSHGVCSPDDEDIMRKLQAVLRMVGADLHR